MARDRTGRKRRVLTFEELTKVFPGRPQPAVDRVAFEARDGEILGLVGLNGAGKTTTIRIAAGVIYPTRGRVLVDGRDIVEEKRAAAERLAWVPEIFPFEPNARALPLMVYFAGLHGRTGPTARARCRELLADVGLSAVENRPVRTFSQGMRKRLSLACAMVSDPSNLLLDEILNGLDPEGIAFVRDWVLRLRREGRTVLLSSHLLAELQAVADRVAIVHQGRLLTTIDRAGLAAVGEPMVRLVVENLDGAAKEYLESVGSLRVDGPVVYVSHPKVDAATVNAELVRRGYRVSELHLEGPSLEAYFLGLIGAAR